MDTCKGWLGRYSEGEAGEEILRHPPICNDIFDSSPSFLLPASFDLPALLTANGLDTEWASAKARDKLACVVHLILEGAHLDARHDREDFFVSLHSRMLGDLLGSRYAPAALTALDTLGVIEVNPSYSVGRFAKSYRLAEPYRHAPTVFRPIRDKVTARKLQSADEQRTAEAVAGNPTRRAIFESLRTITVSPEAGAFADSFPFKSSFQRSAWLLTLRNFAQGRFWLTADENTGRVFHNVTQCPRELRRFLRLAGEPVAEVDIGAAQPFFALSLFPPDHPERRAYAELVTAADFYGSLFDLMPKAKRRSWGSDVASWTPDSTHRDRFKKHTCQHVFYGTTPEDSAPAVFEALGTVSPWLAGELALRRAKKDGATALARELQSKEAELVLGRVIPRIVSELPDCHAVTIHDGILCPARFASEIRRLMEEEAESVFGVRPNVKVKGAAAGVVAVAA